MKFQICQTAVNLQKCVHLGDLKVGLMQGPGSRYPSPSGDTEAVQNACAPCLLNDIYHAEFIYPLVQ